jgi:hypothetical protein
MWLGIGADPIIAGTGLRGGPMNSVETEAQSIGAYGPARSTVEGSPLEQGLRPKLRLNVMGTHKDAPFADLFSGNKSTFHSLPCSAIPK